MEEQQTPSPNQQPSGSFNTPYQQNLPNATSVLVLGILSIVCFCWWFSIIGIILGIIALVLAGKDLRLYQSNQNLYTLSSYNNLKAGRVCAIIGISIASIVFILTLLFVIGVFMSIPFWGMVD